MSESTGRRSVNAHRTTFGPGDFVSYEAGTCL